MPYRDGKRWRGVVKVNGVRVAQKSFNLKKEATKWEREERDRLQNIEKRQRDGMDLMSFCNKYLDFASRFSEKTYKEKQAVCKRILKSWGAEIPVANITPMMVEDYLSEQKTERSANAANKDRKNLLAIWNKGKKTYGIKRNPFADTEKFPHDRATQYTPPSEDILKLLMAATRKERVFLDCYLQTGARRSEIFQWTWVEDINFEKREYRLGTRKTKDGSMEYEYFPMSDELYESLWWWWNNRNIKDSPYVFTNDRPGPYYGGPYKIRKRFMTELCKRAGIRPFGFHALRRFVASTLADAHKSANSIRRFLRHKKVATTERYIQNINNDLKEMTEALSTKKLFSVRETLYEKKL